MKSVLLSLFLFTGFAWAQPVLVPNELLDSKEVNSVLKEKCVPDCLVLDQKDWAALQAQIEAYIKAKIKEGIKNTI